MRRAVAVLAPLALVAVLLGAWELACRSLAIPAYFLPAPSRIGASLVADWALLLASAWNTLAMALMALVVASVIACSLAQITTRGAMATTGVTCSTTASGWTARSSVRLVAVSSARTQAKTLAASSAASAMASVFQAEVSKSGQSATRLAPICDGVGRK